MIPNWIKYNKFIIGVFVLWAAVVILMALITKTDSKTDKEAIMCQGRGGIYVNGLCVERIVF